MVKRTITMVQDKKNHEKTINNKVMARRIAIETMQNEKTTRNKVMAKGVATTIVQDKKTTRSKVIAKKALVATK